MVVFLRFHESLPLTYNKTSGSTQFVIALWNFVSLFPVAEVAHFYTCKLAKRRRISHQMINRLSLGDELQYKR